MSVTVTPLPNKINQNPDRTNNADADNTNHTIPFYIIIMMPNTIGLFATAYRHNDYSLAVFSLLVFLFFVLVDCCLVKYFSMPKNEKLTRKFWLKFMIWFLYTIMSFGPVYLFSYFISLQTTMALYAVVLICSVVVLYAFIVADLVSDCKIKWSEEHQTFDAGKSYEYSVLEKV